MNRELAAAFGHLPPNPEMIKEAVCCDAFSKLAAEAGVDLSLMTDAEVMNEFAAFRNQIKLAEVDDAKVAEAARIGRVMAHVVPAALWDSMRKTAAPPAVNPSPLYAELWNHLAGVPQANMPAVQQKVAPLMDAFVEQGHMLPDEAGDIWTAIGGDSRLQNPNLSRWRKLHLTSGAKMVPDVQRTLAESLKARTSGPMALEEILAHGGGAKAEGLLSKLSPVGLGEAMSKGQWGRAAGKVAPIGAALLAGKWLLNRRRENQMASQPPMAAPPMGMAGV